MVASAARHPAALDPHGARRFAITTSARQDKVSPVITPDGRAGALQVQPARCCWADVGPAILPCRTPLGRVADLSGTSRIPMPFSRIAIANRRLLGPGHRRTLARATAIGRWSRN